MSYSPTVGRFLQRDPLGMTASTAVSDEDVWAPNAARHVADPLDSERRVVEWVGALFGAERANDRWLWQYSDGGNLYGYVGECPTSSTDASGMDRYVTGGGGMAGHHGLAVDMWKLKDGKWVKQGQVTYDFSADYRWKIFVLGSLTLGCPGRVGVTAGINGNVIATFPSSPFADGILMGNLDAACVNPPIYHIGFYNCNWFVTDHWLDGIEP